MKETISANRYHENDVDRYHGNDVDRLHEEEIDIFSIAGTGIAKSSVCYAAGSELE